MAFPENGGGRGQCAVFVMEWTAWSIPATSEHKGWRCVHQLVRSRPDIGGDQCGDSTTHHPMQKVGDYPGRDDPVQ